ncbi:MAG: hypothetical protein K9L70_16115 [Thiohalocapsa sp.]|nr:hypothetical protein [Thiohalocapsa sp.]MCF7993001.1 hypothetical protein [Thiohalocapsa sp.]
MPLRRTLVLLAVLLLSGCIKLEQTLTLHADGSGTLAVSYGVPPQLMDGHDRGKRRGPASAKDDAARGLLPLDVQSLRERLAAELPEGVEVVSVSGDRHEGWRYLFFTVAFDTLTTLRESPLLQEAVLSAWRDDDGNNNYELVQPSPARQNQAGILGDLLRGYVRDLERRPRGQAPALLSGLRVKHTVVVPTRIVDTNATVMDGNRAQWIFDMDRDPEALSKLERTDFRVVFSCDGIDLPALDAAAVSAAGVPRDDLQLRLAWQGADPDIECCQGAR